MKNHIKNYIKIMGLAAVPFGTAQATDYESSVTQEYKCDPNDPKSEKDGAMHFRISVKGFDNRFRGAFVADGGNCVAGQAKSSESDSGSWFGYARNHATREGR